MSQNTKSRTFKTYIWTTYITSQLREWERHFGSQTAKSIIQIESRLR